MLPLSIVLPIHGSYRGKNLFLLFNDNSARFRDSFLSESCKVFYVAGQKVRNTQDPIVPLDLHVV